MPLRELASRLRARRADDPVLARAAGPSAPGVRVIRLLVVFMLSGPLPSKRCATVCFERGAGWQCPYDEQRACSASQFECVARADLRCVPRVVRLGTWDPVPLDYTPRALSDFPASTLNRPGPWGEYPTERAP